MNVRSVVALQGDFDSTFPDLRERSADEDRVPGRDLAELVLSGLTSRNSVEATGPFYEEPFFELRCLVGNRRVDVLCYIYEPAAGTLVVEAIDKTGFLARLNKGRATAEVATVVHAIHETLANDGRVGQTRWFEKLPARPFGNTSFSMTPWV